jgi:Pyrimidine dimer DNA glycosylase
MNIFVLDSNPSVAAALMLNKHIVKMALETAQLLCTTVNLLNDSSEAPYKTTHKNHPSAVWARESIQNYFWLIEHGLGICSEYTKRYGKIHKCQEVIEWCLLNSPKLPDVGLTPFAQAMPDEFKNDCAVQAYRNYYRGAKYHLLGKDESLKF